MKAERRLCRDQLTHERLLEVLDYNQETGIFIWKVAKISRAKVGDVAGYMRNGYIFIMIDGNEYRAHRLSWFYVNGEWPSSQIDHINGIRDDNRLVNLRTVNHSENGQNQRKAKSSNTTGFLGVSFHKARKNFTAQIELNGKKKHLGCFDSAELAHQCYIEAKRGLHPFCTI